MLAFALFIALESSGFSCSDVPSISEFSEGSQAVRLAHDFRHQLLTLDEVRAVLDALPLGDEVEEQAKRAVWCWLRGFSS